MLTRCNPVIMIIHFKFSLFLCAFFAWLPLHCTNHIGNIEENKFDYQKLKARAEKWNNNGVSKENVAIMLSVFDELYFRKEVVKSTKTLRAHGSYSSFITNASVLRERLLLAERKYHRQCHNKNEGVLLFACLITKNDGVDLQEWLVWQIVIVGVNHIVVFLNDPEADNTWTVLQPFIEEGYVTAFNRTAQGYQQKVYSECISLIRAKACYYSGKGKLPEQSCHVKKGGVNEYYGNYSSSNDGTAEGGPMVQAHTRQVWVTGFDSDEFPIDTHHQCFSDILLNYSSHNGLMLPWARFGHSQKFLANSDNLLVTETFTERRPDCKPDFFGKAFSRVSQIHSMDNGHVAVFHDGQLAVTEFYRQCDWHNGPMDFNFIDPPVPRFRLHHYLTKSVEHLVKKWVRGMADYHGDKWGRPEQRYATDWTVRDLSAMPMVTIVRTVLLGE
jgi:hypothetical protein